jgi:protein tyrosine/serine phosphatase
MLLGANFHVVIPGQLYRSGQPSPALLASLVRHYGIHTVVNLRGDFEPPEEYQAECRCARDLHLTYLEAGLWSSCLPTPPEARRLVDALDQARAPVLLHCGGGSDRTGLATALFLLLHTDMSLPRARMEMSIRYGHVPFGPAAALDHFLDKYGKWLECTAQAHSADRLRWWVRHEYHPSDRCR